MVSEKPLWSDSLRIKDVHEWDRVLRETCRKDDDLKVMADFHDEFTARRSNLHIDVASAAFNVNR